MIKKNWNSIHHWLFFVACLLGSQALLAADLYVSTSGSDSNSGSASAPLRTIKKAASLAAAGTTVHVSSGTYAETLATSSSGTASAPIKYVSDTKWGARLVPASSSSDTSGWSVSGNYIVIDGFDLDGQSSLGWRHGFYLTGSHIMIQNNHIHHIGQSSACDSNGGGGIDADGYYGGGYHDVLNNLVHHIGPGGPGSCGTFSGIYMASHDWTVKNNISYQNTGDGITSYHDSVRGYVINNTVFRNWRGIIMSGGGFINLSQGGPFVVENNIVYDNNPNGSAGGYVTGIGVVDSLVGGNLIANNYVYNNRDIEIYMGSGLGSTSGNITSGSAGFVNYIAAGGGDYHLASTSQLIDKGLSTYAPTDDFDGKPRPQGAGVDIGAYEVGTAPAPSPSPAPAPSPSPAPSVKVNATQVSPGQNLTVSVTGTGTSVSEYVALYLASAADTDFSYQGNWQYLNGSQTAPSSPVSTATLTFKAPMEAGTYNLRLFGGADGSNRLAISSNIQVVVASPSVKVNATQYLVGQTITITVVAQGTSVSEWIGMYIASNPDSSWSYNGNWMYLNGSKTTPPNTPLKTVTLKMKAPSRKGYYNIRLFPNAGYGNRISVSQQFQVK